MSTQTELPKNSRILFVAAAAALGGFLFGFDTAVVNGAVDAVQKTYGIGNFATGFAVAAALLGSAVGAWFAGALADRIGRLKVMRITALVFLISAILTGLAFNVADFTLWRFIGGMAVGAASVVAPAYIAEIAPAARRGGLGSLQQLAITVGIFVALLSDTLLARIAGGASDELWLGAEAWRWMFMVAAIPAVLYGAISYRIPESPRFLIHQRRDEEAHAVLAQVMPSSEIDEKISDIKSTINIEKRTTLKDLKGDRFGLMPIIWVGILLSVFQQFVGINVIFYYSNTLWQSVGFSESDAFLTSTITAVTNIAVTFVAIALIDKIGRKRLLLIGSAGMAVTMLTLALLFITASTKVVDGTATPDLGGFAAPLALVAANLYVVFFGATWGPAVWVLLGEMFNNKIRALGLAIGAAAQWIANFIVTLSFPPLSGANVGLPYFIYSAMAVLSFIFVAKAVQETRGRELEDM